MRSISRAINNLEDMDKKLSLAIDARREFDFKSDAAFFILQNIFLQKRFPHLLANEGIFYGSCQFPALGFVVERFKGIESFRTEPFWKIILTDHKYSEKFEFTWDREKLFDEYLVSKIMENITEGGSLACVIDMVNISKSRCRPLAMDTIEMEKLSFRILKINSKTTMQIADSLYGQGFISYPRTETNIFPEDLNLYDLVEAQCFDNRWGGCFIVHIIST